MLGPGAAGGLCAACKHFPACIYEKASARMILQCEQFEKRSAPADLCATCEKRDSCIYPKPEGGVWRCEEYV